VLLMVFALAAVLLATVGIYGVMALNVSQRVGEFGIRLALGAAPGDVVRLVLGHGIRLALAGVAIGLVGAASFSRYLGTLLFEVKPVEPVAFACVALALAAVALGACYIPARRATEADPIEALRYE